MSEAPPGSELTNEPPYWCEIVPKNALAQVQGLTRSEQVTLADKASHRLFDADRYGCNVEGGSDPRLGLSVEVLRGAELRKKLKIISTRFEYDRVTELPSEMGEGGVSLYTGWAHWSCADREVLIYLVMGSVVGAPGESEQYIVPLLKVVQERYAQLAKCGIGPLSEKVS